MSTKRQPEKPKPRKPRLLTVGSCVLWVNGLGEASIRPSGAPIDAAEARKVADWLQRYADWADWAEAANG